MSDFIFPDVIYLQENTDGEVTWCAEQQNDDDAEYVRFDFVQAIIAERDRFSRAIDIWVKLSEEEMERERDQLIWLQLSESQFQG